MFELRRIFLSAVIVGLAGCASEEAESAAPPPEIGEARSALVQRNPSWFRISRGGKTYCVAYFGNQDITTANASAERLVIAVHGADRGAAAQRDRMVSAANRAATVAPTVANASAAGATPKSIVIAPFFMEAIDATDNDLDVDNVLDDDYAPAACTGKAVFWNPGDWPEGGFSSRGNFVYVRDQAFTTFEVLDLLAAKAADKALFPMMKEVVVAGHSAGGQLVSRYAAINRVHDTKILPAGLKLNYVVSAPSSYMYMDNLRYDEASGSFAVPVTDCNYNRYRFGLERLQDHDYMVANGLTVQNVKDQFNRRAITYLIGELDDSRCGDTGLSTACGAEAQGATRMERAHRFNLHLHRTAGAHASKVLRTLPNAEHSSSDAWRSDDGMAALFGRSHGIIPSLVSPRVAGDSVLPKYQWFAAWGVETYHLRVRNGATVLEDRTLTAAALHCVNGGLCTVAGSARLPTGVNLTFEANPVLPIFGELCWAPSGAVACPSATFRVGAPPAPTALKAPSRLGSNAIEFDWTQAMGSKNFEFRVTDSATGALKLSKVIPVNSQACGLTSQSPCCTSIQENALPDGSYDWSVRGTNGFGASARTMSGPFNWPVP